MTLHIKNTVKVVARLGSKLQDKIESAKWAKAKKNL